MEFIAWCWKNWKTYKKLWDDWKDDNFSKRMSPSIDRIDPTRTYTLDNIQWLSNSENAKKKDKLD